MDQFDCTADKNPRNRRPRPAGIMVPRAGRVESPGGWRAVRGCRRPAGRRGSGEEHPTARDPRPGHTAAVDQRRAAQSGRCPPGDEGERPPGRRRRANGETEAVREIRARATRQPFRPGERRGGRPEGSRLRVREVLVKLSARDLLSHLKFSTLSPGRLLQTGSDNSGNTLRLHAVASCYGYAGRRAASRLLARGRLPCHLTASGHPVTAARRCGIAERGCGGCGSPTLSACQQPLSILRKKRAHGRFLTGSTHLGPRCCYFRRHVHSRALFRAAAAND